MALGSRVVATVRCRGTHVLAIRVCVVVVLLFGLPCVVGADLYSRVASRGSHVCVHDEVAGVGIVSGGFVRWGANRLMRRFSTTLPYLKFSPSRENGSIE